jgi:purine-nucleoside phosphorylase
MVRDVCGSVFDLDLGFVSFACCTACSSFLLIFPLDIHIPPSRKANDIFPDCIKKILMKNLDSTNNIFQGIIVVAFKYKEDLFMSVHIGAKENEIAETVLLPGDPLRAKYIAETFLENPVCYNEVRNMFGYTGTYKGKKVSVQGTGMGVPSISIYVNELMQSYNVQNLIRVGTCGAIQKDVKVRDVILAMTASTDSQMNRITFGGIDYAPTANFDLLKKAYDVGVEKGLNLKVGNVFTADMFYNDNADHEKWAQYQILAIEMETAALYTLAAKYGRNALSVLTVSDHLLTGEETTAEERQTTFNEMIEVSLEAAIK